MVRLVAKTPLADEVLGAVGGVVLTEVVLDRVWSVAPFQGQASAVDAALKTTLGTGLPNINKHLASTSGESRSIWAGRGRALVIAPALPGRVGEIAAVTEVGDGIAALRIEGAAVEAVLARLVPVDLRVRAFAEGTTARTMVGHMQAQVTRIGPQAFEIMVMRSMGHTLVHDLTQAARMVAARG